LFMRDSGRSTHATACQPLLLPMDASTKYIQHLYASQMAWSCFNQLRSYGVPLVMLPMLQEAS